MEACIPTRRSPRSIERFCNTTDIPGLNVEQIATFLALSHCTGWSADLISDKVQDIFGLIISAEQVWEAHSEWVLRRSSNLLSHSELDIAHILLRGVGKNVPTNGAPLNRTTRPQTVKFAEVWSPKLQHFDGRPLFPGFTTEVRAQNRVYLSSMVRKLAYDKMTPIEESLLVSFGSPVSLMCKDILKRWAHTMWRRLREEPELRPIREQEHVRLIMTYLDIFQTAYESKFGKMQDSRRSAENADGKVFIKSTGYGTKVFVGLLMADRLHAVNHIRKVERERIGFVEMEASLLDSDLRGCPVCQDRMGFQNPEGTREAPIKLVICCGQVIGNRCLKIWLNELIHGDVYRDTCPVCRFKFPESFVAKLFRPAEYELRLAQQDERGIIDLTNSTLSPPQARNPNAIRRPTVLRELEGGTLSLGQQRDRELIEAGEDDDFDMEG